MTSRKLIVEIFNSAEVVCKPAHQVAFSLFIKIPDGQVENFMKHIRPHIIDNIIADRIQNI